ncbi:MAG: hypothetical protein L0Z70_12910 [Chloroflexi bacterium]|nr:hypothetical protein [Chloroflexota bacterium]
MSKLRVVMTSLLIAALMFVWGLPAAMAADGEASAVEAITLNAPEAAGGVVTLTVTNKTGAKIDTLVLTGDKSYTFYNIPTGKSTYQVEKGKYKIEYKACGVMKNKKVNLNGNFKFNTVACKMAKVTVNNTTGGSLTIVMVGPVTYTFNLGVGVTKISVIKGVYDYTGYTVCGVDEGSYNFKGNVRWAWWCY